MSDDKPEDTTEAPDTPEEKATADDTAAKDKPSPSGPKFEDDAPDPLAGVRRWGRETWDGMEGKTVSMRTYVGSIAAVIVLMMLARCGG